jgi:hypothetical protein
MQDEPRIYAPTAEFSGAFTAPRAQEAIVSLFPCGETFSKRQAGVTALLRKERAGWRKVTTIEDAFSQDECRLVGAPGGQRLLCQANVGPNQGIMTGALCVVSAEDDELTQECPLRVTDVAASGCFSDGDTAGPRHTWAADIKSWTPVTIAGSPGARVEVSIASLKVPPGENVDEPCQRAIERLEKAPRETIALDLVFDGRKLSLTPESKKRAARFSWAFDSGE